MNKLVRHIVSVWALLCLLTTGSSLAVAAERGNDVGSRQQSLQKQEQTGTFFCEQQEPLTVFGSRQTQRVGSSRITGSSGSKTGRNAGKGIASVIYNNIKYVVPYAQTILSWHDMTVLSPRMYYVIALRRILC